MWNVYSGYMCDFVLFRPVAVVSFRFLPTIYRRGVRYGACSCFYFIFIFIFIFRQLTPRDASPCICSPHFFVLIPILHSFYRLVAIDRGFVSLVHELSFLYEFDLYFCLRYYLILNTV